MTGPAIALLLEFEKGRLLKTHLEDAPSFSYRIAGDAKDPERELFEAFIASYTQKKWDSLPKLSALLAEKMDHMTPFQRKVLHAIQKVAPGATLSYGALAEHIGRSKAARAVGTVCHINPFPFFIPCHRIIAAGGSLHGFAFNPIIKKKLLDFEA